ncbi:DapH/DapD/GlmU-related protein [Halarcobacter ebronensis]|uniref:Acetyltransferase n=1 Tax=Halarcobacter ebronensis TaxID=1462615 RepID=A0A4V1M0B0_9BACT|nr:DapH/DapD/GlmU-related protein [Halarcobacter ebronensis]QKF81944.1 phosphonate metabolism protein, transferase hexapeptide repeat family [Halarcobacter ebronensis]RXK04337.1 acetyltransferase [Halarcobacter ebronensis]
MVKIESLNKKEQVTLGEKPYIATGAVIDNSYFGKYTEVGEYANISNSTLDDYSYVSEYTQIYSSTIGKFSNIAANVRINPGFHPYEMPCQHHFLYRKEMYGFGEDDRAFFNFRELQRVEIGHDTWIGHGAIIMPGIKIGNGAIVGSNAVVTKDVPSYAIVAGVSAKVLKYRFSKDIIKVLEEIAWWNWSHKEIKQRIEDLKDIREFIYKYSK